MIANSVFNPREHLISIKNRQGGASDYLPSQWRLEEIGFDLLAERSLIAQETLRISGNPYDVKYIARFLDRIEINETACWLWTSTLNNKGYARMGMYQRPILMHRWSYLLFIGAITDHLELDHLCRTPRCVNPDHLEPVTHRENNLRGASPSSVHARKAVCPYGHVYDEVNTYLSTKGKRECRTCKRNKARTARYEVKMATTHCPQGHLYDEANSGVTTNWRRYCKTCAKIYTPTYKKQLKERAKTA